jgi:hypothetical protein
MSPLEKEYQKYVEENPTSEITFEEWKQNILSRSHLFKEHRESIMEIQKMAQKLLDDEKLKQNK